MLTAGLWKTRAVFAPEMYLDGDAFREVVATTPLVSIDLVVENSQGEFLLGLRKNRPAQGFWFVPGGRIRKSEVLDDAFSRIARSELGIEVVRAGVRFLGVYEHHYDVSVISDEISTHYVVLAYHLSLSSGTQVRKDGQHFCLRWFSKDEAIADAKVHQYAKRYLDELYEWPEKGVANDGGG